MFSLGLLTICVLKYEDIKRRYKVILVSIGAAVGIFVLFVVIQYSLLYGGDIWKNLTSRLSMQGQLFWSTYNKMKSDTLHIKELGSEIAVFFNRPALAAVGGSMEYGIRKIMMYNAPSTMVVTKIASGASYTDSTSSSLYYYFGSSGLLLGGLAVGSIYYHMTDYLASVIKRKNIIEIVFAMSLYWKLWITCGMSDIQTLFQWSSLAIYAVLIVFKFFRIMDKKRIKTIQLTDEVHSEK
jgi:hypothetical protein